MNLSWLICPKHSLSSSFYAVLLILLLSNPVIGSEVAFGAPPEELLESSEVAELAQDSRWLSLLAYENRVFRPGRRGMVKTPGFYLHEDGRNDPHAELKATLKALFAPTIPGADDAHAACLFPARRQFIFSELNLAEFISRLPTPQCRAYTSWRERIETERVALIFADAYMGNPASMFGHTLLRLDSSADSKHTLTSFALNHAAQTGEDHGVIFAMRGVLGSYPGSYAIMPYYQKVNEYTRLDRRDLWEYKLNLDDAAIDRLLAHLWELDGVGLPYYFFYQNCSLRLMYLLEIADPDLDLVSNFNFWAIPADTVRAVKEHPELVDQITYRPSAARKLDYAFEQLTDDQSKLAKDLAYGEIDASSEALVELPEDKRAHILEAGYEYLDYLAQTKDLGEESRSRRYNLLLARSRLSAESLADPPRPDVRPDEGHRTGRYGIGFGQLDGVNYAEIQWRGSYHDLLDPPGGYLPGAQIEMLDLRARYYQDDDPRNGTEPDGGLELERLNLVNVRSITPRNQPLPGITWGAELGAQQHRAEEGQRALAGTTSAHVGSAWRFGDTKSGRLVVAGATTLRGSPDFDDGYRAGVGGQMEILYSRPLARLSLSAESLAFHDNKESWRVAAKTAISITSNSAIRLHAIREKDFEVRHNEVQLLMHFYF
ncbi:hypothetical protein CKO08_06415 [Halorhodospira halochloris]|nr:hypothetical protein [Halorhodospira halochloris]